MPKNKGRGGKLFRKGKKKGLDDTKKTITFRENGEEYGLVTKMLGNRRISVLCNDGKNRIASIPGKFKKKVWINMDDIVLLNIREYQDDKADVIYKYAPHEVRILIKKNELNKDVFPDMQKNEGDILFESEEEEESDKQEEEEEEEINIDDL